MQNQELQGSIPAGLGTTRLRYLDLSSNQLSSTVPGTFVGLVNVTEVYLNDNNLSGFPSSALAGMQSLTILCAIAPAPDLLHPSCHLFFRAAAVFPRGCAPRSHPTPPN